MASWIYEAGIGENRAALVEHGVILEAAIELPDTLAVGTVAEARLAAILVPGRRGIAALEQGGEALIEPLPHRLTEGQRLRVEIVREAIPEPGRAKLAKGRVTEADARSGPTLLARLSGGGVPVAESRAHDEDRLEAAGWSELLDEARSGAIAFDGGALRMSLTPAMTLFDVDGTIAPAPLGVAGAAAAGRAVRRLGVGGSIGIDLPTLSAKTERQAAAAALDAALPQPFERTAVNGFGFLQVVRRRERASIAELIQADPAGAASRALLRRAERAAAGPLELVAAPPVAAYLEARPDWLACLARRSGGAVGLRADPGLAISAAYVHALAR